ncbi:type IV pilus biogenesis protein PilP [Psychromonas ingrahamii 37]|uniref:Type IV pilus biogenesis protein PilP n=1 Tax=Psychromonas ingrahamii (strain DSM 17664 / CCUG 51855 / 37) TaxID=357804 RepID=A1SRB4_PSYIN|nr:pilus assembly protein PilP [Psychromonas ingrahamii]ABM02029.1 type IV pilus biogenesis protein PilP [Psychromonas ingrahamii 37]
MRFFIILLMTFPLFSCVDADIDDLTRFVAETKTKNYPLDDKVPTFKQINPLTFTQATGRNPFSEPTAEEVAIAVINAPKSCPQPNLNRKKQALEMYSLDNLTMRGTVMVDQVLWGLVQVTGGELYKIKPGYYLGLNHGKVVNIAKDKIDLLELAVDRDGCWQERITKIMLSSSE